MVFLQLKYPLELFVKRKEYLPGFAVLTCRDITLAVESDVKPHSLLEPHRSVKGVYPL